MDSCQGISLLTQINSGAFVGSAATEKYAGYLHPYAKPFHPLQETESQPGEARSREDGQELGGPTRHTAVCCRLQSTMDVLRERPVII
jgi:hypothetical protein